MAEKIYKLNGIKVKEGMVFGALFNPAGYEDLKKPVNVEFTVTKLHKDGSIEWSIENERDIKKCEKAFGKNNVESGLCGGFIRKDDIGSEFSNIKLFKVKVQKEKKKSTKKEKPSKKEKSDVQSHSPHSEEWWNRGKGGKLFGYNCDRGTKLLVRYVLKYPNGLAMEVDGSSDDDDDPKRPLYSITPEKLKKAFTKLAKGKYKAITINTRILLKTSEEPEHYMIWFNEDSQAFDMDELGGPVPTIKETFGGKGNHSLNELPTIKKLIDSIGGDNDTHREATKFLSAKLSDAKFEKYEGIEKATEKYRTMKYNALLEKLTLTKEQRKHAFDDNMPNDNVIDIIASGERTLVDELILPQIPELKKLDKIGNNFFDGENP